jgi:acyl-CoA synthetase (AMP-forming)/AMP-acid ligase II
MTDPLRTLAASARDRPNQIGFIHIRDDGSIAAATNVELFESVARTAASVAARGAAVGTTVVVAVEPGPRFVTAFLGAMAAGCVPVAASTRKLPAAGRERTGVECAAAVTRARLIITDESFESGTAPAPAPSGLGLLRIDEHRHPATGDVARGRSDVAFVQLTSGTTGSPLGVRVTSRSLRANIRAIVATYDPETTRPWVTWLPPYHDMGLIGGLLAPLALGATIVCMSPPTFVKRPITWLRAISDFGGGFSAAPNFAYDMCARRIRDDELEGLDLSGWRCAINGSEPVSRTTMSRFVRRFEHVGFHASSFWPSYGMAENTLLVSATSWDGDAAADGPVSCGRPAEGTDVVVVDPRTREPLSEGRRGEIFVSGASLADGYLDDEEPGRFRVRVQGSSRQWFATGDLGSLVGGDVCVEGRLKNVLRHRGRDVPAEALEVTARDVDHSIRACAAVTATRGVGTPRPILVCERQTELTEEERTSLRRSVERTHGVAPEVVVVEPGFLPKTSSGKVKHDLVPDLLPPLTPTVPEEETPWPRKKTHRTADASS